jgi:hypothetical protein
MDTTSRNMIEVLNLAQNVARRVDPRIRIRLLLPADVKTDGFRLRGYEDDTHTGPALRITFQFLEHWPRQKREIEDIIARWLAEDVLPTLKEGRP